MLIQNNEILKALLNKNGYTSLAEHPSFEVDETQFNANLDEVRHQHPTHDDLKSQSRAVYRILTHTDNTSIPAASQSDSPSAVTVIKAVDSLDRSIRQQIGVLAGKTSVVERAAGTVVEGLEKTTQTLLETEKVIVEKLAGVQAVADINKAQLIFITALLQENERQGELRRKSYFKFAIGIIILLVLLLCSSIAKAAPPPDPRITSLKAYPFLIPVSGQFQLGTSYARVQFVSGSAFVNVSSAAPLPVTIISGGGSGGTSSTFGAAFPATGTAAGMEEGGDMVALTGDGSGNLQVACVTGCSGTTLGQATMANSLPVAIASNQSAVPVSGTFWQATQPVSGTFWQATQPVSGTFWQATQPVSGPLTDTQLRATPVPISGTVTVTDGAGALNVIVDSSALPSGAATVAKQPALGTAGTASADVITIQGISSMTPILATVSDGSGALNVIVDSGSLTANAGTNLNTSLLALEAGGNLAAIKAKTDNIPAQGQALAAASLPVVLTAAQITTLTPPAAITNYANETGGNLATLAGAVSASVVQSNTKQVNGVTTLAGAGAVGTGAQRVAVGQDVTTIAGSAPGTAGSASSNVLTIQGITSMTPILATVSDGSGALNVIVDSGTLTAVTSITNTVTTQGTLTNDNAAPSTNNFGVLPALANTSAPTPTSGRLTTLSVLPATGAVRSDNTSWLGSTAPSVGQKAMTSSIPVVLASDQASVPVAATLAAGSALAGEVVPVTTATTTDTSLRCVLISAASTNSTSCKGSAGNVYGFRFVNTTATLYYLRMYNSSGAPTCSSATGFIETIPIPASATGAGLVAIEPFGEGYTTGIGFCFTGGSSSTDNTNAATGVFGSILYK